MERKYNDIAKEDYIKELIASNNKSKADYISSLTQLDPILNPIEMHPDSEVSSDDFNEYFKDIEKDINAINKDIVLSAKSFKDLLDSTRANLNNIKRTLNSEKERQEDLAMLCNKYTNFSNVISINDKNGKGDFAYNKNAFSLKQEFIKSVDAIVLDITGNGYEGNRWVYNNNSFIQDSHDSSNKRYINDGSILTYYEYSRITASNSEKETFPLVNFDSVYAKCTITIASNDIFNTLELDTDTDDIILESLSTSLDGQVYTKSKTSNVAINNKKDRFGNSSYVYGSGILSFSDCQYVKLTFRANKNRNDTIAFIKKSIDNDEEVIKINTARRSTVRINNISIGRKLYSRNGQLTTGNVISDPVKSISIYANEYVADGFDIRQCVTYTLTINGISYNVVPINTNYNGKKIVRTTNNAIPAEHVHYISESIKNATLTIDFKTPKNYASPFLSDLKILIGGE